MVREQYAKSVGSHRSPGSARELHGKRRKSDNAGPSSDLGPCPGTLCDLVITIVADIYIAMAFVIWIILPIAFVSGGIMYMLGGANPSLLNTAKSTLKGAVIGAIIVLGAYALYFNVCRNHAHKQYRRV